MTKRLLPLAFLLIACAILPAALPAWAGPLEDGLAAYKKGEFDAAVALLRPLAEQGNAQAEEKLGRMYQRGKGVKWYRLAADQGNPLAQVGLGYMLLDGSSEKPDVEGAAAMFSKAAAQGDALAMLALGTLYELGRGVTKDWVQAHKWYALASVDDGEYEQDLFDRAKRAKEELAKQMTAAQIAEAERLARATMPPGR